LFFFTDNLNTMHFSFKISLITILLIVVSRFIPHPPNFTSLIALSFYVPIFFGLRYIFILLAAFILTDFVIGFHNTILFTWGSVILIGLISKFFSNNINKRIIGSLIGAILFFIITNFGVWTHGSYGYSLEGLILCYTLALPFFSYSLISTFLFSSIIETIYKFRKKIVKTFIVLN